MIEFLAGVLVGFVILSWAQARMLKTRDLMMIDGKPQWVDRLTRYKQAAQWLKKNEIEIPAERLEIINANRVMESDYGWIEAKRITPMIRYDRGHLWIMLKDFDLALNWPPFYQRPYAMISVTVFNRRFALWFGKYYLPHIMITRDR